MKKMINRAFGLFALLLGITLVLCGCADKQTETERESAITDLSQLAGGKIGILTGSTFDQLADEFIETPQKQYYETNADMVIAVTQGKLSAFLIDEPMARMLCAEQSGVRYLEDFICHDSYAFAFPKTDEGTALRDSMNEFLASAREDGTLEELDNKWFGTDEAAKTVTLPDAEGSEGTLRLVTNSTAEPFVYIKDGKVTGYDIDVVCRFCEAYGYGLEITDTELSSVVPSLVSGKADIAASCLTISEERAQSVHFSDPYYEGGVVVIVADSDGAAAEKVGFFESIKESFYKNFIKEERWKMFLSGLGVTVLISVSSGVIGAVLGFGICMLRRMKNRVLRGIAVVYIRLMQGMPILVFLMILFYVVFKNGDISPIIVSIIGFSVNFSAYVSEMMRTGIEAVDAGQNEAALALGYTKRQSFFKVVFPQAARHFLPVIKGEFISLVKMTSVVGYISVQDLTKVSDIVRSRTFEAFFPLIVTAVLYFAVSGLLTMLLGRIEIRLDPKRRKNKVKGEVNL